MILVVDGQRIYNYEYQEPLPIATNSLGFIDIEFRLSEEWDGYICTAQFVQHKEDGTDFIASKALYNNHVTFPDGIIPGVLEISLFGYKAGEAERGTTFPYIQPVCRSGFTSTEATPIPPTPDLYSQFLKSLETTKQSIENDKQTVQNASKDAITARDDAVKAAKTAVAAAKDIQSNLDSIKSNAEQAITDIQTEGSTQRNSVTSTGDAQNQRVIATGAEQLRALSTQGDIEQRKVIAAGDEQFSRVTSAGNGAVESVTLEKTNAINDVQNTKTDAVNSVESAKTIAVEVVKSAESAAIQNIGTGVDDTLSISGKAADAKKTGDSISTLNEANAAQDERLTTLEQAGGIATVEPADGDVPLLFYGAALPQTKTGTAMPISYVSKTLKRDDADAETKAQGTSSLSYPKKNQTTKFSQTFSFKNWGAQKKYCMKANWIDLTHARNIVSAQLWGDVVKSRANYADLPELLRTSPNQGAIDGFPALVYANGVYQGRYTINIPKDAWMANMDKTLDTHCILCGENYVSGCFRAAANINGSDWSDELHDIVPDAIKTRWNEVISFVMNSTDDEFKANLGNYFYVDSLIDYDLFALASCGLDSMGKNQLFMTYDGQKWIASMYDMDSTWGLYWNGSSFVASDYARTSYEDYVDGRAGNLLYIRLEKLFYEEIQARWAELKAGPLSCSNIMTRFERFIGIVPPHIVKEDYASTTGGGKFTGIPSQTTNNIQQIRAFALARQTWTDEYVSALTPVEKIPCTGISLDQTELTFSASGTQTLVATVTPSNTTDTVVWSSDDAAVASVSGGVVTAKANGSATITVTCGEYSATCSVSVSGIESGGNTPSEDILYQLATPTTFDGTNYIDTGVQLFAENKPFTVVIDWEHGDNTFAPSLHTVAHCMEEINPWPGFVMQYDSSSTVLAVQVIQDKKVEARAYNDGMTTSTFARIKAVVRRASDGVITISRRYNDTGDVLKTSGSTTYTKVDQTLLLGCYQDTSGTKGRFAKGIMHEAVVYDRVLSDDEVNALFA